MSGANLPDTPPSTDDRRQTPASYTISARVRPDELLLVNSAAVKLKITRAELIYDAVMAYVHEAIQGSS